MDFNPSALEAISDRLDKEDAQKTALSAPRDQPPAPSQTQFDFNEDSLKGISDKVDAWQAQVNAATARQGVTSGSPDAAATALRAAQATGMPPGMALQNPQEAQQAAQITGNQKILDGNPALAGSLQDNPLLAQLASDEYDKLDGMSRLLMQIRNGTESAILSNQSGRLKNAVEVARAVGADDPTSLEKARQLDRYLATLPQATISNRTIQWAVNGAMGIIDNALHGGTQGAAAGLAAGAVVGAPAGIPGMAVMGAAGMLLGAGTGTMADMARVSAGQTYGKLNDVRGADGQPISEIGKQIGAASAGIATYALGSMQAKVEQRLFGEAIDSIAQRAVLQAVTRPTFGAAVKQMAVKTGQGMVAGATVNAAIEASTMASEELAKAVSSGQFSHITPEEAVTRLADATVNGAALVGIMHAGMASMSLYGDYRNAQWAEQRVSQMEALAGMASDSKLRQRSPGAFEAWVNRFTGGTPIENIQIPVAKVLELYQTHGIEPTGDPATDPIFGFVPDMAKQVAEAKPLGADVVVPMSAYVTHLAGTPVDAALRGDLRIGGQFSVNDGKEMQRAMGAALNDAMDQLDKATQEKNPQAFETIQRDLLQKMVAAGRPMKFASRESILEAHRVMTRAERLGVDPAELYKQEALKFTSELSPEQRMPEEIGKEELLQRRPTSDVGHKREKESGRYVGAPDWVGSSPQQLTVFRGKLRQLAAEGEPGRFWYERSSRAILNMVGGDKAEAEKIAGLIAIYSPNATVPANTAMALNAYYQFKAGVPIKAGFSKANEKAYNLLANGKMWEGIKTNSFYQNLMAEISPEKLEPGVATMDMWMALAGDYGMKALDQGPKYKFLEREVGRLAEELGWTPHQTQAAIWTAMKGRIDPIRPALQKEEIKRGIGRMVKNDEGKDVYERLPGKDYEHFRLAHKMGMEHDLKREDIIESMRDFSDALRERSAQMSWEATPSRDAGDLPGIFDASTEQKLEYLHAIRGVIYEGDKNLIAEAVGLPSGFTYEGFSAWQGETGAGAQTLFSVSVEGAGPKRRVKDEARKLLDLYAAMKGYVLHQDAVVWHMPIFDSSIKAKNGVEIITSRGWTEGEMALLYKVLHDKFGTWDIAPGYLENGVRVLNFAIDNKDFQKGVEEIIASLPEDHGGGDFKHSFYRSDGEYISNDWKGNPNGEEYADRLRSGSPDLQARADDLRARVEAVNADFVKRYGWDRAGTAEGAGRSGAGPADLRQGGQAPLGAYAPASNIVRFFKGQNASTAIHELGHSWLFELARDAAREDAPQQLRDDLAKVLEYLGAKSVDELTVEQHEKWARTAEAYLMEGKAPSRGLREVFDRFLKWMTDLYKTVKGLDVPINDEIRGVFDRLLATDEQIAEARQEQGLDPQFKDRLEAGMTEFEWRMYQARVQRGQEAANGALLNRVMRSVRRALTSDYKAKERPIREEVTAKVDARPDIIAARLITKGGDDGKPMRLDRDKLAAMYGEDVTARMPRGSVTAKDGVDPEDVATLAGFDSAKDMVDAVMSNEQKQRELQAQTNTFASFRKHLIDEEVRDRMGYGPVDEEQIRDEAMRLIHSKNTEAMLAEELYYLNRRAIHTQAKLDEANQKAAQQQAEAQGQQQNLRRAIKVGEAQLELLHKYAEGIINSKMVAEVGSPYRYLRDERRAAIEVQKALAAGDYNAAAAAKQRQLLNSILYSKATEAREFIQRFERTARALARKPKLDKMRPEFADQLHALLARIGFEVKRDPAELARGVGSTTLEQFVRDQFNAGWEIPISPEVARTAGNYQALRMPALREVAAAVDSLAHIGREQQKVYSMGEATDKEWAITQMKEQAAKRAQVSRSSAVSPGDAGAMARALEGVKGAARSTDAYLLKFESMIDMLDGGDPNGPWNKFLWQPMKQAQHTLNALREEAVGKWREIEQAMPKGWSKDLDTPTRNDWLIDPNTGRPYTTKLTRKTMLSIALNWGTEDNATKMAAGMKWRLEDIKQYLDANMKEEDWRFVEGVWGMFENFRGRVDDLERRTSGTGIEFVEGRTIDTPHGPVQGKYFPLVYDHNSPKFLRQVGNLFGEKAGAGLFEPDYHRATTRSGSTIARVEGVELPLRLELDVIPWKLGQTMHDLAFREAVMQSSGLLDSARVMEAVDGALGHEYRNAMRQWVKQVANNSNQNDAALGWFTKLLQASRVNTTMVGIGFRISTLFKHTMSAASNSMGELGPKWMAVGSKEFFGTTEQFKRTRDWMLASSPEMRYRLQQYDRDLEQNVANSITKGTYGKARDEINHAGHIAIAYFDYMTAAPTWVGAVRKAQSEGMTDAEAYAYGDKTVRNAHGAQGLTDRSLIQQNRGEAVRMITMFYGFFNHIYNRERATLGLAAEGTRKFWSGQYGEAGKDFASVLWRSIFYLVAPAMIESISEPSKPEKESWFAWGAKAIANQVAAGLPVIRNISSSVVHGYPFTVSPVYSAVQTVINTVTHDLPALLGLTDKNPGKQWIRHLEESVGYVSGLPTGQIGASSQYLWHVYTGEEQPQDMKQFVYGIMHGHKDKEAHR